MRKMLLIGLGVVVLTVVLSVLTASLFANPADLPQSLQQVAAVTASNHLARLPDGEIGLLYYDGTTTFNVLFIHTLDNGQNWSDPDTLNPTPYITSGDWFEPPELRLGLNGDLYAVWNGVDGSRGDSTDIFFARRDSGDTVWTAPERIATGAYLAVGPRLAVGAAGVDQAEVLHVVWYDESDTESDIRYIRSTDRGDTWSDPPVVIDDTDEFAQQPAIAVKGDRVHVVFAEIVDIGSPDYLADEVRHIVSEDGGLTWPGPSVAVSGHGGAQSTLGIRNPAIAVTPDSTVHVAWVDATPSGGDYRTPGADRPAGGGDWHDIFHAYQHAGGAWTTRDGVSYTEGGSYFPTLAADSGGRVHLLWQEGAGANKDIYYAVFDTAWSLPENFSNSLTDSWTPGATADVGRVGFMAVWLENSTPSTYRIDFFLSSEEVWPGDTDQSGTVDAADVLPLAVYWTQVGPAREGGSQMSWTAHEAAPWVPFAAGHADANGDGLVDARDILPIGLNWALNHPVSGPGFSLALDALDHRSLLPAYREIRAALDSSAGSEAGAAMIALLESLIARGEGTAGPRPSALPNASPNPAREESRISFVVPAPGEVSLTVYDARGRLVRTLVHTWRAEGSYQVIWDGRDERGAPVPPGAYLCRIQVPGATAAEKILRIR